MGLEGDLKRLGGQIQARRKLKIDSPAEPPLGVVEECGADSDGEEWEIVQGDFSDEEWEDVGDEAEREMVAAGALSAPLLA